MMPVRLLPLALIASLVLLLGGCDDGTSPSDLGGLDPLELADDLNRLLNPLQASGEGTANLRAALPALTSAGVTPLPPEFPAELIGETFTYDTDLDDWEVDPDFPTAPLEGFGVEWYELDGAGEVSVPLQPRGQIFLRAREGGATDSLALTMTDATAGASATLLHVVQSHESTGDAPATQRFTAHGSYSGGSATVDFDIVSDESLDAATQDEDYDLSVSLEDAAIRYRLDVEGGVDAASGDIDDLITATAVHGGQTTVLEMTFHTAGDAGEDEASGTLTHNGDVVANISLAGNSYQFTKPNGDSFPAVQASELNTVFGAMTRTGFLALLNLPLFLP